MLLAQFMKKFDLTAEEVAKALGCSHASIVRYRQGKQAPSLATMIKIRKYTKGRVRLNDWDNELTNASKPPS